MTTADKIARIKTLIGDDAAATSEISVYLSVAEDAIMTRLYPFGVTEGAFLPSRYDNLACRLAARYWNRKGAEGETTHNEPGVERVYANADDSDLLDTVIPFAKVMC